MITVRGSKCLEFAGYELEEVSIAHPRELFCMAHFRLVSTLEAAEESGEDLAHNGDEWRRRRVKGRQTE